jgi:hypothetical protein
VSNRNPEYLRPDVEKKKRGVLSGFFRLLYKDDPPPAAAPLLSIPEILEVEDDTSSAKFFIPHMAASFNRTENTPGYDPANDDLRRATLIYLAEQAGLAHIPADDRIEIGEIARSLKVKETYKEYRRRKEHFTNS